MTSRSGWWCWFARASRPRNSKPFSKRLRGELLEDRLALSWLGVPPARITSISPPTHVTFNAQHDAHGSASIRGSESDYYSFVAPASGSYRIAAQTPYSTLDSVIGLYSATGRRLAFNDDHAGGTDSQLTASLTAGARYYVGISKYTGNGGGAYNWLIDGPAATSTLIDDVYEPNDSISGARNLGVLTATKSIAHLVMADGADWYRFQTTATGASNSQVTIDFQHAQGDLELALYNSSGTRLASSTSAANHEQISLAGRAAGTYYVRVYGYRGVSNPDYSLSITPPAAATTTATSTNTTSTTTTTTTTTASTGGFRIEVAAAGMTASQTAIFQQAADRWEQIIVGDLPNATYNGRAVDDLLIDARGASIDGAGGILGRAAPDRFRSGSYLPYHGTMEFDTADLAAMQANGTLLAVIMHEMGHVLGIGTLWDNLGLISGEGASNPRFTGPQATAAYNQIFGRHETGVPVENSGGAGTRDSHWRDALFATELMTGYVGPGTSLPLSRITAASLADLGYTVNLSAANSFTPDESLLAASQSSAPSGGSSTASIVDQLPDSLRAALTDSIFSNV